MESVDTNIQWYDFPEGETVTVSGESGEFFVIEVTVTPCSELDIAISDSNAPAAIVRPVLGGEDIAVPVNQCEESSILK